MEKKKTIQIRMDQLQNIIKEGVVRLHRQTIIENRIKQINEELAGMVSEWDEEANISPYPEGMDNSVVDEIMDMSEVDFLSEILNNGYSLDEQRGLIQHRIEHLNGYLKNDTEDNSEKMTFSAMGAVNEGDIMGKEEYEILEAYLEAALWTEEEEIGSASISDISDESREKANQDVLTFMSKAGSLLDGIEPSQIGHDLWLTRNGHGAGFLDRGLGEIGEKLADIARGMGSKYAYVGDDGLIYID